MSLLEKIQLNNQKNVKKWMNKMMKSKYIKNSIAWHSLHELCNLTMSTPSLFWFRLGENKELH